MGHPTTELLSAFLDRQVEQDDARAVDAHLLACVSCSDQLAELDVVRSLLRALPEIQPPRSFLLPQPANVVRFPRLLVWTRAATAVAAAFFVMFLTVDFVGTSSSATSAAVDSSRSAAPAGAVAPAAPVMTVPTLAIGNAARREADSAQARFAGTPQAASDAGTAVGTLTSAPWQPVKDPVGMLGLTPLRVATVGTGVLTLVLVAAALLLGRRHHPASSGRPGG